MSNKPAMLNVFVGGEYAGCLLPAGPKGFTAYDSCGRSVGMYTSDAEAAEALREKTILGGQEDGCCG
jgi:hypothetical protein